MWIFLMDDAIRADVEEILKARQTTALRGRTEIEDVRLVISMVIGGADDGSIPIVGEPFGH
jgi:hypothetical protein